MQVFFKHFVSKTKLPGFYISQILVENGLRIRYEVLDIILSAVWLYVRLYILKSCEKMVA